MHEDGAPTPDRNRVADRTLHARLLERDPTATADLINEYLQTLIDQLRRSFLQEDPHLVEEQAIDAVLRITEHPERYDPNRGSILSYLRMDADGDLRNARQKRLRRERREMPFELVELSGDGRNREGAWGGDPAALVDQLSDSDPELWRTIRAQFDATEWQVVELMGDGERRTAPFAAVLGLTHLSEIKQAREVKRVKDKLKKRLERLAGRIQRDD